MSRSGFASSVTLAASGVAIVCLPQRAAAALDLSPSSARGIAEARIGLGGTYAALGLWAMSRRSADAYRAVGVTWLGAAAVRLLSLVLDEPTTDWTFWAYLTVETALGMVGVLATDAPRADVLPQMRAVGADHKSDEVSPGSPLPEVLRPAHSDDYRRRSEQ